MADPVDDAAILAWLDGELPAADAAHVAAAVAADPELQALADAHRALAARLRGAFESVHAQPVPDRLLAVMQPAPAASVTDLAAFRAGRGAATAAPPRRWLPQFAALAASLAIGLFVGRGMVDQPVPGQFVAGAAGLQAAGVLEVALNDQLAAAGTASGPVRVALSFRDRQGRICRSWQTEAQEGIACHAGDSWLVTAALARAAPVGGDYRMATGSPVAALMDGMIAGEPLDAAQEQAAKARGWR